MLDWNPSLYLEFGNERTRPAVDLAARISLSDPARVIDLGCGPGNSTRVLRSRWPQSRIAGLDCSEAMIDQAKRSDSGVGWVACDIADWNPSSLHDLIFANASLQWLPDHGKLFGRLISFLRPGGVLAVQMPFHYDSPLHQVMLSVSRCPEWNERMENARNALTYHESGYYYDILISDCTSVEVWETEYFHRLPNVQAILEWISATGLRPFFKALNSSQETDRFRRMILEGYIKAYPQRRDGRVLLPFRRQFIVATK